MFKIKKTNTQKRVLFPGKTEGPFFRGNGVRQQRFYGPYLFFPETCLQDAGVASLGVFYHNYYNYVTFCQVFSSQYLILWYNYGEYPVESLFYKCIPSNRAFFFVANIFLSCEEDYHEERPHL